ncbi:MAG: YqaA family protein [Desulfobacterales bacterium]
MLTGAGYIGLFLTAFLAATILPLSSEATIAAMAASGYSPLRLLSVATLGNTLGSWVNYLIGRLGDRFVLSRWIRTDPERRERAEERMRRWGSPLLILAWLPVIGDPLTIVAGVVRMHPMAFTFWVALGKCLRYALVLQGVAWINGRG